VTKPLDAWDRFWFTTIPPHIYAALRVLFGLVGCATLIGLGDLPTFWNLHGLVPMSVGGLGLKAFLLSRGLGSLAGTILYGVTLLSFTGMMIGFRSRVAVALAFTMSLIQVSWNYLPLSGADAAVRAVLFCLLWADCGSVWSVDAWIARRRKDGTAQTAQESMYPIAPLRLIRFQIALIYLNAGLWKLFNPLWRDGSAVHYVLQSNVYRRFPGLVPAGFDTLSSVLTYGTLAWELSFAFLILFGATRRVVLIVGVLMHLGMLATIEVGPFHLVMLASYVAFLDPLQVPTLPMRLWATLSQRKFEGQSGVATAVSR